MTVVSVHPDAASLEQHIEVGGPELKELAHVLRLREIEVFGPLSERAVELVRREAAALGDAEARTIHRRSDVDMTGRRRPWR
jgi:hypothetical protein